LEGERNVQVERLILTDKSRFATSWRVRGSIHGGGKGQNPSTPALRPTQPPSVGTGALPSGKAGRAWGMGLTTHPNLLLGLGENRVVTYSSIYVACYRRNMCF